MNPIYCCTWILSLESDTICKQNFNDALASNLSACWGTNLWWDWIRQSVWYWRLGARQAVNLSKTESMRLSIYHHTRTCFWFWGNSGPHPLHRSQERSDPLLAVWFQQNITQFFYSVHLPFFDHGIQSQLSICFSRLNSCLHLIYKS